MLFFMIITFQITLSVLPRQNLNNLLTIAIPITLVLLQILLFYPALLLYRQKGGLTVRILTIGFTFYPIAWCWRYSLKASAAPISLLRHVPGLMYVQSVVEERFVHFSHLVCNSMTSSIQRLRFLFAGLYTIQLLIVSWVVFGFFVIGQGIWISYVTKH